MNPAVTLFHLTPIRLWRRISLLLIFLLPACLPGVPSTPPTDQATPGKTPSPLATTSSQPTKDAQSPEYTAGPTPQPVSRIEITPEALKGIEIQFWHPWDEDGETLQRLVDEFNKSNEWGIRAAVTTVAGLDALDERMKAALQAGAPPDLVAGFPHQALAWGERRPPADLQEYANDPIWGFSSAEHEDFYPAFRVTGAEGTQPTLSFLNGAQVLLYNRTWALELGFNAPPSTLQQFADQVCAAADANLRDENPQNDRSGGLIVTPHPAAALSWILSFDGSVWSGEETGKSPYKFNTPAALEAFAYLRDLYEDGCVLPLESMNTEAEFAGRRGLVATAALQDLPNVAEAVQQAAHGDDWTVIPYPSPQGNPQLSVYGPSLAVFASEPQSKLAAWLLARYLLAPSNHAHLVDALGALPLRQSELPLVEETAARTPQWSAAAPLLPSIQTEPPFQSWGTVRWALSDAFTQLFRSYFSAEQIPAMLNYLDRTAAELHGGPPSEPLATEKATATP